MVTHPVENRTVGPARGPGQQESLIAGAAIVLAAAAALVAHFAGLPRLQSLVGLIVILGIAYVLSVNRRAIHLPTIAWGVCLQIAFALIVLKTRAGQVTFQTLGDGITHLLQFAGVGSSFVFGPLGNKDVWPQVMTKVLGPEGAQYSIIFAFQVLPTIIFIAALFAILYYFGVMQLVVRFFAWGMRRVMKASGAESLNVAASILWARPRRR